MCAYCNANLLLQLHGIILHELNSLLQQLFAININFD
jgi:hypothetical protein